MTRQQYYLLLAHISSLENRENKEKGLLSKEESDKLWNDQIKKANERIEERKKTREEQIKDVQNKIIKNIEENKK